MKDSSSNETEDEIHPLVGGSQRVEPQEVSTSALATGPPDPRKVMAPHTFQLPEMLSYCLSSDLSTLLYCSANAGNILGCPIHQVRANGGILLRHVHFDDRFRVLNGLEEALLLKKPIVVSYRWNMPDDSPTSVLVNHCVAAHSDYGEVITGVIFRITPHLNEELDLLFHKSTPPAITESAQEGAIVNSITLGEDLKPLSESQPESSAFYHDEAKPFHNRAIPFLSVEQELEFLRYLADELSYQIELEASSPSPSGTNHNFSFGDHLFDGEKVYRGTLTKVERDTFSPHYLFSLRDVTEKYLREQELRSLRNLKTGLSASRSSLSDVELKLEQLIEDCSEDQELQTELATCLSQLSSANEKVTSRLSSPFISGRELLLKSTEPLAAELAGNIEMKLSLSSPHLLIWRSVGEELLAHLAHLTRKVLPVADRAHQVEITLGPVEGSSLRLETTLSLPAEAQHEAERIIRQVTRISRPGYRPLMTQDATLERYGREAVFRMVITAFGALDGSSTPGNHMK